MVLSFSFLFSFFLKIVELFCGVLFKWDWKTIAFFLFFGWKKWFEDYVLHVRVYEVFLVSFLFLWPVFVFLLFGECWMLWMVVMVVDKVSCFLFVCCEIVVWHCVRIVKRFWSLFVICEPFVLIYLFVCFCFFFTLFFAWKKRWTLCLFDETCFLFFVEFCSSVRDLLWLCWGVFFFFEKRLFVCLFVCLFALLDDFSNCKHWL